MREFERIFSREGSEDTLESDRIKCSHLQPYSYWVEQYLAFSMGIRTLASLILACTMERFNPICKGDQLLVLLRLRLARREPNLKSVYKYRP